MTQDLKGKTVLLTGGTNGIGLEASVELARRGATLVIVGRDPGRTERALAEIKQRSGSNDVTALLCDFSSQAQIRKLAADFRAQHDRLDVLVNNAGAVHAQRSLTEDGIEATFAVNHLGYFLLTNLLEDLVVKSAPSRIVSVASRAHYRSTLDFDDLGYAKGGYTTMGAYSRSKLANVLFSNELARRLAGKGVTVNCLHPGVVATGIWAKSPKWAQPIIAILRPLFFISAEQGGKTITQLAADAEGATQTGQYFSDGKLAKAGRQARDEALAKRLWDVSTQLTGL
jgi:NAD(P)-dependent dehydrogenase (short-subunit alcohol dehydrogenase family)